MISSNKIHLPQVTLITLTGKDYEAHGKALDISCRGIDFGSVKMIGRPDIKNIDQWNRAIINDLWRYVDTDYCILIHPDGYIINPELWNPEWLNYDYCASPWPLPTDDYSYRDERGRIIRVGNSVSLRSKKLMRRVSRFLWKPYYGNTNEDGFISVHHRVLLEKEGFKFMPFEESLDFGKEIELPEHKGRSTFLFHSL